MEGHQLIRHWFDNGQDYAQGLALAKAHGTGGVQLKLLESGENNYTQGKLRAALQVLLDALSAHANAPAVPASVATAAVRPATGDVPDELKALRARRTATFKQAQHHQGQMRAAPEGPQRFEHARRIKELFRENAGLFAQEAYYLKFGHLPQPAPVATIDRTDKAAVLKRRNTLRTYLSDFAKGKRGNEEKNAAWTQELLELDLVLNHG